MSLIKNNVYTVSNLITMYGGNPQCSMPFVNKSVRYCKFNPKINGRFPNEVWIEEGPIRERGAEYLINCSKAIPVFKKLAVNAWEYLGEAYFKDITTQSKLDIINANPPRDNIKFILQLEFKD